jgi:glutamine cyclotransferase
MTYREGNVFVYDADTLELVKELKMPSEMEEGWGLTHDEKHIWASDGTSQLFKIHPEDFSVIDIIKVKDVHGKAIHYINELELVGEHIYANVLPLNVVIKVDKSTGIIDKIYDFKALYEIEMVRVNDDGIFWDRTNNVMNGIAFRKETGNFIVTGKNWNYFFEVKLE